MTRNHKGRDNCPVTGKPIPNGMAWMDHDIPGAFNSCLNCCSDHEHKPIGSALHALGRIKQPVRVSQSLDFNGRF